MYSVSTSTPTLFDTLVLLWQRTCHWQLHWHVTVHCHSVRALPLPLQHWHSSPSHARLLARRPCSCCKLGASLRLSRSKLNLKLPVPPVQVPVLVSETTFYQIQVEHTGKVMWSEEVPSASLPLTSAARWPHRHPQSTGWASGGADSQLERVVGAEPNLQPRAYSKRPELENKRPTTSWALTGTAA